MRCSELVCRAVVANAGEAVRSIDWLDLEKLGVKTAKTHSAVPRNRPVIHYPS